MHKVKRQTTKKHKPFLAIDLFCGCGGLTQGLKDAGVCVIGGIDNDSVALESYKVNHPNVEVWEKDIRNLKVSSVKKKLGLHKGGLDLLAGCPPCQGFSSMRTLNGNLDVEDERNELIFEFLRFVKELRPKAVMLENVPGLANDERFKRFCRELEKLEYTCNSDVLNTMYYGVPQRRRRLILLASLKGEIPFAQKNTEKRTVRETIADLPPSGKSGDPVHDFPENRTARIKKLIKSIPKDGGSRTDLEESMQLQCHKDCNGFKDVYGRMQWDDVSPTITGGCFNPSKGRFLHPEYDRAITIREAALLQSFPPNYYFPEKHGKSRLAILIGNALPPEFIRRMALCIITSIKTSQG